MKTKCVSCEFVGVINDALGRCRSCQKVKCKDCGKVFAPRRGLAPIRCGNCAKQERQRENTRRGALC